MDDSVYLETSHSEFSFNFHFEKPWIYRLDGSLIPAILLFWLSWVLGWLGPKAIGVTQLKFVLKPFLG